MFDSKNIILLLVIIIVGFFLRFCGAQHIVFDFDERINARVAKNISFDLQGLRLPLVDKEPEGILAERYLMRIGQDVFGDTRIGARLPCIIVGVLTILLVYLITWEPFGARSALIASFFVTISLCSIASTRKVSIHAFLIFLSVLSLFLFFKAISRDDKRLMLVNGFVMGVGFWFKESMFFLIPIYGIFLIINPQYRIWLKSKYLWMSFLIALCLALPLIGACLHPEAHRFSYIFNEATFGPSLNSLGLYLGEIIVMSMKALPKVLFSVDPHYPPGESVMLGFLILLAGFGYKVKRDSFGGLLKVCFLFNFILFCFLRRNDTLQGFCNLGSLMWGIIGFTPGMILAAVMVNDFIARNIRWGKILFLLLALFLVVRAWSMSVYPLDCFFPFKEYCVENRKLKWEIDDYLREGDRETARQQLKIVYGATSGRPAYKKKAALRLAELLVQEHKYAEAKEYLDFILLQNPGQEQAVRLLRETENPSRNN